jgi:hypothetical protein
MPRRPLPPFLRAIACFRLWRVERDYLSICRNLERFLATKQPSPGEAAEIEAVISGRVRILQSSAASMSVKARNAHNRQYGTRAAALNHGGRDGRPAGPEARRSGEQPRLR